MTEDVYVLKVEAINKYFGPTHANKNVSLSIKKGEIRGIAGENGSGKSTLVSIIAGINNKDSGDMFVNGEVYDPGSPTDAIEKKIGIVVQELGLVGKLTMGANIYLGRAKAFVKFGLINVGKMNRAAHEQLEKWGLGNFPITTRTSTLSVESRKLVELTRALSIEPEILILDEVTQALSHDKRNILYDFIADYKAQGHTILVISHDLEELIKLTDNITVMRDGAVVDTRPSSDLDPNILRRMMIGRDISGEYYRDDKEEQYEEDVILEIQDLGLKDSFENVSFELHKGEILGICGLSDSGIHALGKSIFGLEKERKGKVILKQKNIHIKTPRQSIRNGIAYVPKDRDSEGLMLGATILANVCLPSIKDIEGTLGYLDKNKFKKLSTDASKAFDIKSTGIMHIVGSLSGGNKQKVNLSRWMIKNLDVLILDCPTRGVDVGVKAYIYEVMRKAKNEGLSIILVSDELPEAIGMADRILVMKNGKMSGMMRRGKDFSEESIIEVMI